MTAADEVRGILGPEPRAELEQLRDRLSQARDEINAMADRTADRGGDWQRLAAKAEGVDLALSYLNEMTR